MSRELLAIPRQTFIRAILIGHLLNIILGTATFFLAHAAFGISTWASVAITAFATMIGSILVSMTATEKLSKPMRELSQELSELHSRVESSEAEYKRLSSSDKALFNQLPLGIITFDRTLKSATYNHVALNLLQFDADTEPATQDVLAKLENFFTPQGHVDVKAWLANIENNKLKDQLSAMQARLIGSEKTTTCDIVLDFNKHDSFGHEIVVTLVDRSNESAGQEKQMEFISLAAHELRGPLTIMRGLIDVFENEVKDQLDAEHIELLTRMAVSSRQLSGYVDNILNVSRVDEQSFAVHLVKADWQSLLEQTFKDLSIRARAHHRELSLNVADKLSSVAVDTTAIQLVINNLVDNAIKYSREDGKIEISVSEKNNEIETTVTDHGIGIPASLVDNLFTKFYRSHKSKQVIVGTGLGLYLCKAIVDAHGGKIWVRSSEGHGTTLGFTLPTYASVADSLKNKDNQESEIVRGSHGWIKNHALIRR